MANIFYTPTGNPPNQTRGISALMRAEFQLIANAFALVSSVSGINAGLDSGTANAYVVNPSTPVGAYNQFTQVIFLALNSNTGASTINVSGLGAVALTRRDKTALLANDIVAGGVYLAYYDGTEFQLQANPLSGNANGAINFSKSIAITSAATIVLDNMTGNYGHITGTTGISTITLAAGSIRQVIFDGSLTLTAGANLVLPGGYNITTNAGDAAVFVGDGAGKTILVSYVPATGVQGTSKITSVTLASAAASINFLSAFSSLIDNYIVILEGFSGDSSGSLRMQMAVGGVALTNTIYGYAGNSAKFTSSASNTPFGAQSGAATYIQLTNSQVDNLSGSLNGKIEIFNVNNSAGNKNVNSNISYISSGSIAYDSIGANCNNGASVYSGFKLFLSTGGNFQAGCTIKIYGYNN